MFLPFLFCSFFSLFGEKLKSLTLHKHQFEPYEIYNDESMDNFIRGMVTQPTQDMDSSFSRQVTPFIECNVYCFVCGCQNESSQEKKNEKDI